MEISFHPIHPWAILPRKHRIDPAPRQQEAALLSKHFAWVRASRSPELCWPWRVSQEAGWVIESPVSVAMDAIHDVEATCPPEQMRYLSMLANATENWSFTQEDGQPGRTHFTRNAGWTALYDFLVPGKGPERMFYINGKGSVEWVLGWEPRIPDGYSVLILPFANLPHLEIMFAILDSRSLASRAGRTSGISMAIRPTGPIQIQRGQPIARLLLLHPDTLRARATTD